MSPVYTMYFCNWPPGCWKQHYSALDMGQLDVLAKGHKGLKLHSDDIGTQEHHPRALKMTSHPTKPRPAQSALSNTTGSQPWRHWETSRLSPRVLGARGSGPPTQDAQEAFLLASRAFFPSVPTYRTLESCWRDWSRRSRWATR